MVERHHTSSTHRNDHSVLPLKFWDIFISPVELRVVEWPESAHHFHAALRRVPHVDASGEVHKTLSDKPANLRCSRLQMFTLFLMKTRRQIAGLRCGSTYRQPTTRADALRSNNSLETVLSSILTSNYWENVIG